MTQLRFAVIGVGHLGRIHARLLGQIPDAQLVAIADSCEPARAAAAAEFGVPGFADFRDLLGKIDAAIIAVPSRLHHAVGIDLLQHGVHTFVEKPITLNIADADDLVAEAARRRLTLQVGHVERFNPAFAAIAPHIHEAKFIDAVRSGPFTCRSTDIGVVLDLMIHDIDLVLALVNEELVAVQALGSSVIGPNEDWAQARLTFANGCVANLFASRVAWQAERSLQVISDSATASIDFGGRKARLMRVGSRIQGGNLEVQELNAEARTHLKDHLFEEYLPLTDLPVNENANPLLEEQRSFIAAIRGQQPVTVTGEDGRRALDVAERILTTIAAHQTQSTRSIIRPPHFLPARVARRMAG